MATDQVFYDSHTLNIVSGTASEEQIIECFTKAINDYQTAHNVKYNYQMKINVIINHEGSKLGIAFGYITHPAVFNLLVGNNPDGSERVEYYTEPEDSDDESSHDTTNFPNENNLELNNTISDPIPPIQSTPNPPHNTDDQSSDDKTSSDELVGNVPIQKQKSDDICWADLSDSCEDEYGNPITTSKDICWADLSDSEEILPKVPPFRERNGWSGVTQKKQKIIRLLLEPLVTIPQYRVYADYIKDGEEIYASLTVKAAWVLTLENKYVHNVLKCKKIPSWLTVEDLKKEFKMYATDSTTIYCRTRNGKKFEDTYPFVNVDTRMSAFIIFDPNTRDAQFALHMTKKLVVSKVVNGKKMTSTLMFYHSFSTERDALTKAYRQPVPKSRPHNYDRPHQSSTFSSSDTKSSEGWLSAASRTRTDREHKGTRDSSHPPRGSSNTSRGSSTTNTNSSRGSSQNYGNRSNNSRGSSQNYGNSSNNSRGSRSSSDNNGNRGNSRGSNRGNSSRNMYL